MLDETATVTEQDRRFINIREDQEIRYWTAALGVTRTRLEQLVREHGPSARMVRSFLNITKGAA